MNAAHQGDANSANEGLGIELKGICRAFGAFRAVDNVDLHVNRGELVSLLGPSGSGKTTLLRIIAGLETSDAGAIHFFGEDATDRHARERRVGFVFQHYALFRHMTVFENVAFGLRARPRGVRPAEDEIRRRVLEWLRLVQLEGFEGRFPSQLSGGQRQRVALARALAVEPRVLLLDEPFGALDVRVRVDLRRWLRHLHDSLGITTILVTHDQEEALELSDRVVLLDGGRVAQVGTPADLYDSPNSAFVLEFLGDVNRYDGRVQDGALHVGALRVPTPGYDEGAAVQVGVRCFDLKIWHDETRPNAAVERLTTLGDRVRVDVKVQDGPSLSAQFPRRSSLLNGVVPGASVQVEITRAFVYPAIQ